MKHAFILSISLLATSALGSYEGVFMRADPLALSREGYNLILKHEVGGGAAYYSRYLVRPTWPGGASGVTIGVGYDLGYNTRDQIAADWRSLSPEAVRRLQSVAGVKGTPASRVATTLRSLSIPWDVAEKVYQERTIPRFTRLTERAYAGTSTLHPHIQSAMLSWVFNRGEGITGSARDREKRAMRTDIPNRSDRLPTHFRASKRIWIGRNLDGLIRRREDEARLVDAALKK